MPVTHMAAARAAIALGIGIAGEGRRSHRLAQGCQQPQQSETHVAGNVYCLNILTTSSPSTYFAVVECSDGQRTPLLRNLTASHSFSNTAAASPLMAGQYCSIRCAVSFSSVDKICSWLKPTLSFNNCCYIPWASFKSQESGMGHPFATGGEG